MGKYWAGLAASIASLAISASLWSEETDAKFSAHLVERSPSTTTILRLRKAMQASHSIEVRYTPVEQMERIPFDQSMIRNQWRYGFMLQCGASCEGWAPELLRRLSAGLRTDGRCPMPFSALILLHSGAENSEESALQIYVAGSGRLFSIDKECFFIPDKKLSLDIYFRSMRRVEW
jgi:hypothetical protein